MKRLTGLFVVVALLGLGCEQQRATAQAEARRWAAELGYTVRGASCANVDSDDDGYVSCTVVVVDGDTARPMAIECRGAYSVGNGCRRPKLGQRQAQ